MILQVTDEIFQYVMEQNEFEVYYQPIISMGKGRITGMEALLRASYLGEPISPEGLFSYAKKVNKSFELDFLCHMCALQGYEKENDALLFLNLETSLLKEYLSDFDRFVARMDSFGIERDCVVLEIKEQRAEDDELLAILSEKFKNAGFLIALDDVGSGHASFSRIVSVEPDVIKVDRSVISDIDKSYLKQQVLQAICETAQRIGATIIAEGTETRQEVLTCMFCGVDWFQGFYYDKAMKAEEIREQSYLLKCRRLSEIHRKEEEEKIEFCSGKIRKFKGIFQRFLDGIPVKNHEDMTAYMNFFTEKCDLIEDIYILREDGMQVSDAVMSPNVMIRNRKMFSAPRKGDYHVSKQYYYMVVHRSGKIYVSNIYISCATGNYCRTLSSSCEMDGKIYVLCIDFIQESLQKDKIEGSSAYRKG